MDIKRIKQNVEIKNNGCWEWNKSTCSSGYGQLTENKKYWLAHRYSYSCCYGEIGKGKVIRHTCHNPKCCNPKHLISGTQADNWNDSRVKNIISMKKRRGNWEICGVKYRTCREASDKTGISLAAIVKHTKNGVFDVVEYRRKCKIAAWTPKV